MARIWESLYWAVTGRDWRTDQLNREQSKEWARGQLEPRQQDDDEEEDEAA